ncbi:hypothetical protein AN478_01550 [Thiohalorhabdus denitrificans]|uniref:MYXO-CTERM domain-containing protein n=1 Tax=Thiohalorhabdus denitrificans TaxID=381306 RepID=A0A0P9EFS9_9GAMM|nr:hypothetical protein [Thiohalorhabdus denitrificans]KPV41303.1 hypothetical protein AN478_01550 [Thiohalorhabdus denitrificans]SCY22346.1 MYXO-CTERM domain-containing protein [Thiohalorhabdus denitrificans]
MRTKTLLGGMTALFLSALLVPTTASALAIELSPHNQGIGEFSYDQSDSTITIQETWEGEGPGALELSDLEGDRDYTIIKEITNNSGSDWGSLANEILVPTGDGSETEDQASFVPEGFSHSHNTDGVSFAQRSGLPRDSDAFTSTEADEFGERDYLEYMDGILGDGDTAMIRFGLRENGYFPDDSFLLSQTPGQTSAPSPIPSPATPALLGLGLLGLAWLRARQAG